MSYSVDRLLYPISNIFVIFLLVARFRVLGPTKPFNSGKVAHFDDQQNHVLSRKIPAATGRSWQKAAKNI